MKDLNACLERMHESIMHVIFAMRPSKRNHISIRLKGRYTS